MSKSPTYTVDLCKTVCWESGRWAWKPLVHVSLIEANRYRVSIHALLPGGRANYAAWEEKVISKVEFGKVNLLFNNKTEPVWDIQVRNPMDAGEEDADVLNWMLVAIQLTLNLPEYNQKYPVWVRYAYNNEILQKQGTLSYPVVPKSISLANPKDL